MTIKNHTLSLSHSLTLSLSHSLTHSLTHSLINILSPLTNFITNFFKKNNKGFSLIELIVVMGMMGGAGLLVMNTTKQFNKSSAKYQFDSDVTSTLNEINGILSHSASCTASLGGKLATLDTTVTELKYKPASVEITKFSTNTPFGNGNITIQSYKISGFATGALNGVATFTITFSKKQILGGGTLDKTINLNVVAGADDKISACNTAGSPSASSSWATAVNDVYNMNTGNVGIGTNTPVVKLDVAGGIRMGNQIQVTICDVANEGTLRYNKTTHTLEYCGASGTPLTYGWKSSTNVTPTPPPTLKPYPGTLFCNNNGFTYSFPFIQLVNNTYTYGYGAMLLTYDAYTGNLINKTCPGAWSGLQQACLGCPGALP